jgi:DNA-binding response OmpR family regulator
MKILVVEDELELLNSIVTYFSKSGHVCEFAASHISAEEKIDLYDYDCVVLDISLPGGSGLDILNNLKKRNSKTGVIIVSAKDSLDDKIKGLDYGADDYITKPFHLSELNARMNSLMRRVQYEGNDLVELGNLQVDLKLKTVSVNHSILELRKKEFDLLLYLISNKDKVVNKNSLVEHIWGDASDQADSYDFLYSQIKNLRKKLADFKSDFNIEVVYGVGYKFVET